MIVTFTVTKLSRESTSAFAKRLAHRLTQSFRKRIKRSVSAVYKYTSGFRHFHDGQKYVDSVLRDPQPAELEKNLVGVSAAVTENRRITIREVLDVHIIYVSVQSIMYYVCAKSVLS